MESVGCGEEYAGEGEVDFDGCDLGGCCVYWGYWNDFDSTFVS